MMITVLTLSARTHVLLNILLELLNIYVMDIGPFSELNVYIIETESFHFLLQIMTSPIWLMLIRPPLSDLPPFVEICVMMIV